MNVASRANAWIVGAESGLSSKVIWSHMMGAGQPRNWGWSYPHDPDDLGRCLRLLDLIPEWKERMPEMAQHSRQWAGLVSHWDELRATMDVEVGIDWSKGRSAPRTYDLMKKAMSAVNPLAKGWRRP